MALSDAVKRRILKANAIGEHRMSALSEQDFIDLASRHGGIGKFTANGTPATRPAPQPDPPVHWRQKSIDEAAAKRAADKRAADKRAADKRAADKRAADKRAADKRAADKRAADKRAADKRAADKRAAEDPLTEILTKPQVETTPEFDAWLSKTSIHFQKGYRELGPEKQREIQDQFIEETKPQSRLVKPAEIKMRVGDEDEKLGEEGSGEASLGRTAMGWNTEEEFLSLLSADDRGNPAFFKHLWESIKDPEDRKRIENFEVFKPYSTGIRELDTPPLMVFPIFHRILTRILMVLLPSMQKVLI